MTKVRRLRAFTLIELLVVVAIIAILIGILLPSLARAKQSAIKTACSANLKQVGMGIQMYQQNSADKFPTARYMPPPFLSIYNDPALPTLILQMTASDQKVFKCPGDNTVFSLIDPQTQLICGSSFCYNIMLCGKDVDDTFLAKRADFRDTEIPVCYDYDGGTFTLTDGSSITVPSFHLLRNLLFADGHVGNYQ
jgi:prepilin-type N-terminal cleavage/methylation domain-containing protein/prepilin-type processing-associated H-X9-DG protein